MGEIVGPVEVASFRGLDEAEVARGALESQGIATYLENAHLVAAMWTLSQATGGVKLIVSAEDAALARQLLNAPAEIAAGENAGGNETDREGEDADDAVPEADLLAERAWKSALIGFLAAPPLLHLWSFWLLRRAYALGGPVSARAKSLTARSLILSGCAIALYAALYSRMFSR